MCTDNCSAVNARLYLKRVLEASIGLQALLSCAGLYYGGWALASGSKSDEEGEPQGKGLSCLTKSCALGLYTYPMVSCALPKAQ